MVLINGVKYACERCIRGHRVTTCNHTDQPLMMIKPKGRPSTTCNHCKELRKNKNANPSGVCTCGRLEKKRLAQKAKEEARAKAKEEKKLHECRCAYDETCRCHSSRRRHQSRKVSVSGKGSLNSGANSSRPVSQHFDATNHVMSPVSMDSSSSIHNGSSSVNGKSNDGSGILASGFLDTDIGNGGKVSKEFHQVPSLASISSLHSGQSLDQKVNLPQSPLLGGGGSSLGFLNNNNGGNRNSGTFTNWGDEAASLYSVKSDSKVNLGEQGAVGMSMQSTSSSNPKRLTSAKSQVGNVRVPLEEYLSPSDNFNNGKINETSSPMQEWYFEKSPNEDPNISDQFLGIDGSGGGAGNGSGLQATQSNGLLDMFMDSSTIPILSKGSLVTQDKFDPSINNNTPASSTNGPRGRVWSSPMAPEKSETLSVDGESVRSVEAVSLIPSYMDIPERAPSLHNVQMHSHQQQPGHYNQQKQGKRSASVTRNHRQPPSTSGRSSVPVTINPSMVSSIDDTISVNSLQSPTGSVLDNHSLSTPLSNGADYGSCRPERVRSPLLGLSENNPTSPQFYQQQPQIINSAGGPSQSELDQLLGFDTGNDSGIIDNSNYPDRNYGNFNPNASINASFSGNSSRNIGGSVNGSRNGNNNGNRNSNGNLLFQNDMNSLSSPAIKGIMQESSPMGGNQTVSPPSQLLTEKGFADLDDFMSTL